MMEPARQIRRKGRNKMSKTKKNSEQYSGFESLCIYIFIWKKSVGSCTWFRV